MVDKQKNRMYNKVTKEVKEKTEKTRKVNTMKRVVLVKHPLMAMYEVCEALGIFKRLAWYIKPELKEIKKKLDNAPQGAKMKDVLAFEEFKLWFHYSV